MSMEDMIRSRGGADSRFETMVSEYRNRGTAGARTADLVRPGSQTDALHREWDALAASQSKSAATAIPAAEKATVGGSIKDLASAGVSYGYAVAKGTIGLGNAINIVESLTYRPSQFFSSLKNTGLSQHTFKALVDWGMSAVGTVMPPVASAYYQAQAMSDGFDAGTNVVNAVVGKDKVQTSDAFKTFAGVGGGLALRTVLGTSFGGVGANIFGMGIKNAASHFVGNGVLAAKVAAWGAGAGVLGSVYSGIKSLVSSNSSPPRAIPLSP